MDYYSKYLKYKLKYTAMKNQIGGNSKTIRNRNYYTTLTSKQIDDLLRTNEITQNELLHDKLKQLNDLDIVEMDDEQYASFKNILCTKIDLI